MKKQFTAACVAGVAILTILAALLTGCAPSEADVVGTYKAVSVGVAGNDINLSQMGITDAITITLQEDGSATFQMGNQTAQGSYGYENGNITLYGETGEPFQGKVEGNQILLSITEEGITSQMTFAKE